jgi:hypothetical protein
LYFACLEIIAEELSPENFNFELEHDSELLAAMFKMDTLKVEKIMRDFIELGLFEISPESHRVACYKLAKRLDNATSQNIEVRSILSNFKQLKVSASDLKQIRLDKNRLEEKKEENLCASDDANGGKPSKRFNPPTFGEVSDYCQERNNGIDPSSFLDFYEARGWLLNKNKMKDWKAAVRTWESRRKDGNGDSHQAKPSYWDSARIT